MTYAPPTQNPQPASTTYALANQGLEFAINADVTPSGGTQFNIPITLNSRFGGVGTSNYSGKDVTPPANAASGNGHAVDIDDEGNIYVAGSHTTTGGAKDFAVTKFLPGGSLDTTFGNGGTKTVDFGSDDIAYDVELRVGGSPTDARLYLAGTTGTSTKSWAVCSLKLDGTLDTGFDLDGKKSGSAFQNGNLNAVHYAQTNSGSGNIILAGVDTAGAMTVYALGSDTGTTVWSRSITFNTSVYAYQEAFDALEQVSDNKVVVGGWACRTGAPGGTDFALARLNGSDGTFDTSFDGDGKLTTNFGSLISGACNAPSYDTAYSLVESVDHTSIYAVGKTNYTGYDQFAVASFLESNGSRDADFHKSGLPNGLATGPSGHRVRREDSGRLRRTWVWHGHGRGRGDAGKHEL